jgi:hypothetical protein
MSPESNCVPKVSLVLRGELQSGNWVTPSLALYSLSGDCALVLHGSILPHLRKTRNPLNRCLRIHLLVRRGGGEGLGNQSPSPKLKGNESRWVEYSGIVGWVGRRETQQTKAQRGVGFCRWLNATCLPWHRYGFYSQSKLKRKPA